LTSGQEALWFLYELAPGNIAYNVALCGRVRSILDPERLAFAIRRIVERHPMLRCTFAMTEQGPRQRIGRTPETCLGVVDASGWDEGELRTRVADAYKRPFDLRTGPVFRAVLFRRRDDDHVLLFVVHHIVFDAWSLGVVLGDLSVFYEKGPSADPGSPRGSYEGFVRWQKEMLESGDGREMWEYWRARLGGPLPVSDVPGDRTRPVVQSFRGGTHHFEIPEPLCAGIRELARSENATPFMVLAAAFHALLHRYTGREEVLIGTPLAGRPLSEFEDVVGYFVNLVVLRAPIAPGTTFRRYVAEMREAILGGLRYGDFPFLEIVKRLNPVRDNSRTPLFQVVFNLVKAAQIGAVGDAADRETGDSMRLGSLEIESFPLDQQEGQFDLDLNVLDTGGSMPATLKYSTDLFDADTIVRMAGHFRTLLGSAVANPDRPVPELALLSPEEERTILVEWNRTEGDYSTDTTLHALVEAQVDRTPDAVAVVSEAGEITYRELEARANRIAHRLRKLGAGPGALVGLCVDRSIGLVAALLGVLKSGAAYLPIDSFYPRDRIAFMLDDARVSVLLAERRLLGDLPAVEVPVVVLDADPSIDGESASRSGGAASPEDLAYVIYTSGSTGRPKGAMIHHRAIVNHVLWMRSRWPLGAGDAVLQNSSASFDASVWEIWNPLAGGARVVIGSPGAYADPAYLVRSMIDHRVTHALIVPSVLELVAREPGFERCSSLRCLYPGGEALSRALVESVWNRLDVELVNLYGPTETTINATSHAAERGQGPFSPIVPIGRPIANHRAYVLDAELRPVPVGVPGELHLGGAGVGRGYLRRPELTEERFIPDPFVPGGRLYKTGDVCRYRADGVIEYIGRNDHQVKVRGFRIELGEIEAALCEHPAVGQAVVVGRREERGDVRLVAYLVPAKETPPEIAALRAFLRDRLPGYMVPSAFMVLPSLPLTSSGKVDRNALPAAGSAPLSATEPYEAPRTCTEKAIASIWKEVLRLEKIGIHDNFFELGGHSLLATRFVSRLREAYGVEIPLRGIFEAPTVAEMAVLIDARSVMAKKSESGERRTVVPREEFEL
jgi:amino acid adenylation domain-containing protein